MSQLKQAGCAPRSLVITPVAARRGHGASQAGRAASYYYYALSSCYTPLPHATYPYLMLHHALTPCYTPLLLATRPYSLLHALAPLLQAGLLGGEPLLGGAAAAQGARERDFGAALAKALRREPRRMMRTALRRWEGWLSVSRKRASLRATLRDPAAGRALRAWAAHATTRRRSGAALQRLRQQVEARS